MECLSVVESRRVECRSGVSGWRWISLSAEFRGGCGVVDVGMWLWFIPSHHYTCGAEDRVGYSYVDVKRFFIDSICSYSRACGAGVFVCFSNCILSGCRAWSLAESSSV